MKVLIDQTDHVYLREEMCHCTTKPFCAASIIPVIPFLLWTAAFVWRTFVLYLLKSYLGISCIKDQSNSVNIWIYRNIRQCIQYEYHCKLWYCYQTEFRKFLTSCTDRTFAIVSYVQTYLIRTNTFFFWRMFSHQVSNMKPRNTINKLIIRRHLYGVPFQKMVKNT